MEFEYTITFHFTSGVSKTVDMTRLKYAEFLTITRKSNWQDLKAVLDDGSCISMAHVERYEVSLYEEKPKGWWRK